MALASQYAVSRMLHVINATRSVFHAMLQIEFHQSQHMRPTGDSCEKVLSADGTIFVTVLDEPYDRSAFYRFKVDFNRRAVGSAVNTPLEDKALRPNGLQHRTIVRARVILQPPIFPPKMNTTARAGIDGCPRRKPRVKTLPVARAS